MFCYRKNNGCIYIKQNWTESYSIIRGAQNFCFVYQNEQIHEPATVVSYEKSGRVRNDTVWTLPVNSIISSDNWLRFRDDRNRKIEKPQFFKISIIKWVFRIHAVSYTRVNSEKFQNFDFNPKLSFLMKNHKNDN